MAWLNAIEAYKETGNELPINLRVRAICQGVPPDMEARVGQW